MVSDKKVNFVIAEEGLRLTLSPGTPDSIEFIPQIYGCSFIAEDIELHNRVNGLGENELPPKKLQKVFQCRGKSIDGWTMSVIGDEFKTDDLIITISARDHEEFVRLKGVYKNNHEFKVPDVRFGKNVGDWEIQSNTYFWMNIEVSPEMFDQMLDIYRVGDVQSIDIQVTFKTGDVYRSNKDANLPFVEPDTHYLLPDKNFGIDSPKIAHGYLNWMDVVGNRINNLKPIRHDLEEYYDDKYRAGELATEQREQGLVAAEIGEDPMQTLVKQFTNLNMRINEANNTFKYIFYGLIALCIAVAYLHR